MTSQDIDPVKDQLTKVARGGAVGLAGALVSAIATFALVMVVTNSFATEVAGKFFSVTSLVLLLLAVAGLGADTGLGRFMLRFVHHGQQGDIVPALRAGFVPPLVVSAVMAVTGILAAPWIASLIGLEADTDASAVRFAAGALPIATLGVLALATTRAFGSMKATALIDSIFRSTAQLGFATLCAALGTGLVWLTGTWLLGYALASLLAVLAATRLVRGQLRRARATEPARSNGEVFREFWSFTWARGVATMMQMALQRLDIVLIAALLGAVDAAIYTAATRFVPLGGFGHRAIQQVVQPRFAALLAAGDLPTLRVLYRVSTSWGMAVSWPAYVVAGSAPLVYLSLFGEEYVESGATVVVLMAIGMLVATGVGPADTLLLMTGRSVASLLNMFVALTIDVVGCLVLIPRMGITGAAVAWATAQAVRGVLGFIQVRSATGVSVLAPGMLVVVAANAACFALPLLVLTGTIDLTIWMLAGVAVALLPLYALVLWLGRRPLVLESFVGMMRRRRRG